MKAIILSLFAAFSFCTCFAQDYDSCFVKKAKKYTYYRLVRGGVSCYYRVNNNNLDTFHGYLKDDLGYIEKYFTFRENYNKVAATETSFPIDSLIYGDDISNDASLSFSTKWTKEMQDDFRKSKDVAVVVDFSQTKIMGVSVEDFPIYYASKYGKRKEIGSLILKQIKESFMDNFRKTYNLPSVKEADAKYVIHYDFYYISEDAGASGEFYVMKGNEKSKVNRFYWGNGRWNEFDILMKENIEKYFKMVSAGLHPTPFFNSRLYKRQMNTNNKR